MPAGGVSIFNPAITAAISKPRENNETVQTALFDDVPAAPSTIAVQSDERSKTSQKKEKSDERRKISPTEKERRKTSQTVTSGTDHSIVQPLPNKQLGSLFSSDDEDLFSSAVGGQPQVKDPVFIGKPSDKMEPVTPTVGAQPPTDLGVNHQAKDKQPPSKQPTASLFDDSDDDLFGTKNVRNVTSSIIKKDPQSSVTNKVPQSSVTKKVPQETTKPLPKLSPSSQMGPQSTSQYNNPPCGGLFSSGSDDDLFASSTTAGNRTNQPFLSTKKPPTTGISTTSSTISSSTSISPSTIASTPAPSIASSAPGTSKAPVIQLAKPGDGGGLAKPGDGRGQNLFDDSSDDDFLASPPPLLTSAPKTNFFDAISSDEEATFPAVSHAIDYTEALGEAKSNGEEALDEAKSNGESNGITKSNGEGNGPSVPPNTIIPPEPKAASVASKPVISFGSDDDDDDIFGGAIESSTSFPTKVTTEAEEDIFSYLSGDDLFDSAPKKLDSITLPKRVDTDSVSLPKRGSGEDLQDSLHSSEISATDGACLSREKVGESVGGGNVPLRPPVGGVALFGSKGSDLMTQLNKRKEKLDSQVLTEETIEKSLGNQSASDGAAAAVKPTIKNKSTWKPSEPLEPQIPVQNPAVKPAIMAVKPAVSDREPQNKNIPPTSPKKKPIGGIALFGGAELQAKLAKRRGGDDDSSSIGSSPATSPSKPTPPATSPSKPTSPATSPSKPILSPVAKFLSHQGFAPPLSPQGAMGRGVVGKEESSSFESAPATENVLASLSKVLHAS